MAQSYLMTADQSDKKKNHEAGAYTAIILVILGLLLFLVSWQLPNPVEPDPPLAMQGIEVNLGTDETGSGDDQPILSGDPAPEIAKSPASTPEETSGDNTPDDPDSDVSTSKNETTKPNVKPSVTPKTTSVTKRITNPSPAPPKPKAVFNGKTAPNSNGTGGNGAESDFRNGSNEGIAGGKGDQGVPGGNPNSKVYKGIRIQGLSGRRIVGSYAFQDDFNEKGVVAVDVVVDASGIVSVASKPGLGITFK